MPDPLITLHSWPTAIVHLDGDAFFASCEQAVHPELKGRPVITGKERNIVASMSYEAKALGIKRATPLHEARRIAPHAVIVPSDYETYSLISKRMFSIMRRFTPEVEEASIDEGYAELKGLRRLYRSSYEGIAEAMRKTIERELGISISAGLSLTKTLAKLASKHRKPHGFTAVSGRQLTEFLKAVPISEVCGIGPNSTALLHKRGIRNAFEYVSTPEASIKSVLGKIGVELWRELRGESVYLPQTELKSSYQSISKSKTFVPPSNQYEYVKAQLFRNTESAFIKLRRYQLRAKKISVYIRTQEFKGFAAEGILNRSTLSPLESFPMIEQLLRMIFKQEVFYRCTGVVLSDLEEDGELQLELFEDPVRMVQMNRLAKSIDEINTRYGKHTVYAATGLFLSKDARRNQNGRSERNTLPQRKSTLFRGETFRQRIGMPVWRVTV